MFLKPYNKDFRVTQKTSTEKTTEVFLVYAPPCGIFKHLLVSVCACALHLSQ